MIRQRRRKLLLLVIVNKICKRSCILENFHLIPANGLMFLGYLYIKEQLVLHRDSISADSSQW